MLNIDLWHRFTEQFSAAINGSSETDLASAWSDHKRRTLFYREMVKPLAASLGTVIEEKLEAGNEQASTKPQWRKESWAIYKVSLKVEFLRRFKDRFGGASRWEINSSNIEVTDFQTEGLTLGLTTQLDNE